MKKILLFALLWMATIPMFAQLNVQLHYDFADALYGKELSNRPHWTATIENFKADNFEAAQEAQYKANKLIEVLIKFGVVVGIKDALEMIGFDCGYQVYPQKRFTDEESAAFRKALKEIRYEEEYI